jgi:hypothetical protein
VNVGWIEIAGFGLAVVSSIVTSTLYLAGRMGGIDTRLAVVEALFANHCRVHHARRNTGEFEPINDDEG